MARVLLVSEENAMSILWCAAAAGHNVVVTGPPARNTKISLSPRCAKFIAMPEGMLVTESAENVAEFIGDLALREGVDAILPSSFDCIRLFSRYRGLISKAAPTIPLASLDVIDMLDDKEKFWRFCVDQGLPHPKSIMASSLATDGGLELEGFRFPLIGKPVRGSGGLGLQIIDNAKALSSYLAELAANGVTGETLIQECFDGQDIDFNGYAVDGEIMVGSVMKTRVLGDSSPITITSFVQDEAVEKIARRIIRAVGYSGPLNIDMRIDAATGKVFLIEVNPRFWDRVVVSLIDGMNFVGAGIAAALGQTYKDGRRRSNAVWSSTITRLVAHAVRNHDREAFQYLTRLTWLQVWYGLVSKLVNIRARMRRDVNSSVVDEP